MNKSKARRFDAWGNPILDCFEMRRFYSRCERSTKVLKNYMPHRYVVIPDCEIRLYKNNLDEIEVIRLWPAGEVRQIHLLGQRAKNALRRLWKAHTGAWRVEDRVLYYAFRHTGCVRLESAGKYGARA